MRRPVVEKEPTEEEMLQRAAEENLVSVNQALRKTAAGETRVLGHIVGISCASQPIVYTVKSDTETFKLVSVDFQGLTLNTFDGAMDGSIQVGCGAKIADALAVLTFKPKPDAKKLTRGEMIAIEFVPKSFRVMNEKEIDETVARLNAPIEMTVRTDSPGDRSDFGRAGPAAAS
jgi:hypothetical protein